jgi:hypothetical protein
MAGKAATDMVGNSVQASGEYNGKIIEYAATNTHAAFEYFRRIQRAKSSSEMVELTSTHIREQTEILTAQAKKLSNIAQKLMPTLGDFMGYGSSF